MGLFDFIKSQLIEVIEWTDSSSNTMVYRFPVQGNEIKMGAKLIVRESQVAVFVDKGRIADVFEPGMYTLATDNMPFLTPLMSWPHGFHSPFKCEVYFFNPRQFIDQKWGTPEPIWFQDPVLRMARLRARGTYSFQVRDPAMFVNKIVGQQGIYASRQIEDYMRGFIVQKFIDLLGEMRMSLFELPAMYNELSAGVKAKLHDDFGLLGLTILAFALHAITPTEETSKAMEQATAMGAVGEADYLRYQAAQAMRESAAISGDQSEVSTGMGIGAGMGLGAGMAGMVSQAFQSPPPSVQGPGTGAGAASFHASGGSITLEQVRQAIDNLDLRFSMGEISEENYNRLMKKWQDRVRELGG